MMQRTNIQYADYVSNPLRAYDPQTNRNGHACIPENEGCRQCWANLINIRFGTHLKYNRQNLDRVKLFLDTTELDRVRNARLRGPFKHGDRPFVFMCDMTDWLLPEYDDDDVSAVLDTCLELDDINFLFLTKRYDQFPRVLKWNRTPGQNVFIGLTLPGPNVSRTAIDNLFAVWREGWPVWISHEPALGPLNLPDTLGFITLLVSGGESGPAARRTEISWHQQDKNWAADHNVNYFFKQWGRHVPAGQRDGELDGETWQQMPGHAMRVEIPAGINLAF